MYVYKLGWSGFIVAQNKICCDGFKQGKKCVKKEFFQKKKKHLLKDTW